MALATFGATGYLIDRELFMTSIILEVVEQHAEEAAFLWGVRDAAVCMPHYSLDDLTKLDNRLDAHIDGLRIACEARPEISKEVLSLERSGEMFAGALLAFERGEAKRIQTVIDAVLASPETARGLVSAFGWLPYQQAEPHIRKLLTTTCSDLRRVGIAASAIHRQDPGPPLIAALSDRDPLLKARALRAIGQLGRLELLPSLQRNLTTENALCRFAAAWSAALLGDDYGVAQLQQIALLDVPYWEEAAQLAFSRLKASTAHGWLKELSQSRAFRRIAVVGVGVIGYPAFMPWLYEQMTVPPLARIAGEAFTMIAGVDLSSEDLDAERPEGYKSGPTEDPDDENVEMDPDENLPWPHLKKIETWWGKHRAEFRADTRYILGKPMTIEWLQKVLRIGRQRQRAVAALELAIRQPGQRLFEVRAPGFRQQEILNVES
jgi:uncharacterized protein (TIGR02270 family)